MPTVPSENVYDADISTATASTYWLAQDKEDDTPALATEQDIYASEIFANGVCKWLAQCNGIFNGSVSINGPIQFSGSTAIRTADDAAATPVAIGIYAGDHTGAGASGYNGASINITAGDTDDTAATTAGVVNITGGAYDGSASDVTGGGVNITGGATTSTTFRGGDVAVTGGTSLYQGGIVSVTGGDGATNGGGGPLVLASGDGAGSGGSGAVTLTSGTPGATGSSSAVTISTGPGGATSGSSGNITLAVGSVTSGTAGHVYIASEGVLAMLERSAAQSSTAGRGKFWVRNDTPNTPMFTDDAGNDYVLNSSGGTWELHGTAYDAAMTGTWGTYVAPSTYTAATFSVGTSSNSVLFPDHATNNYAAVWDRYLPEDYAGGGLTLEMQIATTTGPTSDYTIGAAIERRLPGTFDFTASGFAAANTVAAGNGNTANLVYTVTITFTDGADMDSLAAGEPFRLLIYRSGGDTFSGNVYMLQWKLTET